MAKRKSQSISAGITAVQYEETLAKYAATSARVNTLTAELEEELTKVRDEFVDDITILTKEMDMQMAVIKGYYVANRESLFEGKKKSRETLYGLIGFRTSTPSLKTVKGKKWEDVLALLEEMLPAYVRKVNEPDKEKLLADRDKEGVAEMLPKVGVVVSQEEKFFIELKSEAVAVPA